MTDYQIKRIPFNQDVWEERTKELVKLEIDSVCVYTDGGYKSSRPLPNSGWGVHAYFFKNTPAKKTAKYKDQAPTRDGYKTKSTLSSKSDIVDSVKVLNMAACIDGETNNIAELEGAIAGIDLILNTALSGVIKKATFILDSEYVLNGINMYMDNWQANHWRKADGRQIANLEHWKAIEELKRRIKDSGIDCQFTWARGHVNLGNIFADKYANMSIFSSIDFFEEYGDEDRYFEGATKIHPLMLETKVLYFPGRVYSDDAAKAKLFYGYSTNDNQSPIWHIGRNSVDTSICLLLLNDPDPKLPQIMDNCEEIADLISPTPMALDLKNLLASDFEGELDNKFFYDYPRKRTQHFIEMSNLDGKPLIEIIQPARNSFMILNEYDTLLRILRDSDGTNKYVVKTDVTECFYDKVEDKKGTKFKFKLLTELAITVPSKYYTDAEGIKEAQVTLTFGLDLPRRRVFSNIDSHNPVISVVCWHENDALFRYGVLIELGEDKGFWSAAYSNTFLVK